MMQLLPILALGTLCGVAWALQAPLSSMISHHTGPIESAFVVHLGGALGALAILPLTGVARLPAWQAIPWYCYGAGLLGVVAIAALVWMVPRVGVASTITVVIAAQLIASAVLDHFGVLGLTARSLEPQRLLGLGLVLVGVWQTVRSG